MLTKEQIESFKGKIIAFEGLDNSFKETNYNAFVSRLREDFELKSSLSKIEVKGMISSSIEIPNIITESFPRYGNQSALMVEKWLDGSLDRNHMKKNAFATCSLYAMDRLSFWYESVHGLPRNITRLRDSVFVFDRYSSSNAIYNPMGFDDNASISDLLLDSTVFGNPSPNIVVWMRMKNFDTLASLIAKKQNKDANELDLSFIFSAWKRSEKAIADGIFDKAGIKLIVIECLDDNLNIRSREELSNEIYEKITQEVIKL